MYDVIDFWARLMHILTNKLHELVKIKMKYVQRGPYQSDGGGGAVELPVEREPG